MPLVAPLPQSQQSPSPPFPLTRTKTPTGILLGKYQLGRLLGRGSFAKVHEATLLDDNNSVVAIKVIDKTKTVDAALEPAIIREVSAMRRLHQHPNILKIHEVMATKTKIYLVMELATGGELFAKLRRGRLTESAARRYFSQLVSALDFCHQNGVAHRDVKPQNLLLDRNGILKVSDFGLSALPEQLNDIGLLNTFCGTPAYTAPEVFRRKGYNGSKADAWSCGVILFHLLAGYLPFDDSNLSTMYKKIHRREFKFPSWISKQCKAVIWQLLDPNPETRMSLVKLMETSWFQRTYKALPSSSNEQESLLLHDRNLKHDMFCNGVNAFDIISLSSGLDLSGLLNDKRKEKRYTTSMELDGVRERVREVGENLGYRIEKGKRGVMGLGKGRVRVVVEVVEVAEVFVLVEVKFVDGGGGVEFEEGQWVDLETGLGNIFFTWDNGALR